MNKFISFAEKQKASVVLFCDLVLVTLAAYLAFLIRFDGVIPLPRYDGFIWFVTAALVITPLTFNFFRLYHFPYSFISLTDLPSIAKGVFVSVLILSTGLLLFRDAAPLQEFPRSIIFIYLMLLFLFIGTLRFSKRIYWQIMRGNPEVFRMGQEQMLFPLTSKFLNSSKIETVLVTGGAGYIGSMLVGELLKKGYYVKIYDKMLFGRESLASFKSSPRLQIIEGDILDTASFERSMVNVDTVIHTAAIVGEAACSTNQDLAIRTNYLGAVNMAKVSKSYGVKRFVYFSTCSAYGKSDDEAEVDESSPLRPVDFYGETKIYAERDIIRLTDENFFPTILRLSTVYGLSHRMRFDLVVNIFSKKAHSDRKITIFGGNQWRPLIHVSDVVRAVLTVLEAPLSKVGGRIFNVGGDVENYLISDLGDLIKKVFPEVQVETLGTMTDQRSYRVKFKKVERELGFHPKYTVLDGMREIKEALDKGIFPDVEDQRYYNHLM